MKNLSALPLSSFAADEERGEPAHERGKTHEGRESRTKGGEQPPNTRKLGGPGPPYPSQAAPPQSLGVSRPGNTFLRYDALGGACREPSPDSNLDRIWEIKRNRGLQPRNSRCRVPALDNIDIDALAS